MKKKCFMCNKLIDSYFGINYGTNGMNRFTKEVQMLSKKRKSKFMCDDCYSK